MKYLPALAAMCLLATAAAPALAAPKICGVFDEPAALSDYRKGRTEFAVRLAQVERSSFSPDVESGAIGMAAVSGLDATLAAFPNHVPALNALTRLALKEKRAKLPGMKFPVECYYDRAQRFAPDDAAVYAAYAAYLLGLGLNDKAVEMYVRAVELDGRNVVIHYNLGLAYFKLNNYELANKYAQRAYNAGFPLPGLRSLLQNAGKWRHMPDEKMPPPPLPEGAEPELAPAPEPLPAPAPVKE
ncbi:MAG: tetratricopeptide repeat protein [Burkholderiaceae bacterium]|nr:tetratricopeptide repeat protein [Burkholderiaceae bacterium]